MKTKTAIPILCLVAAVLFGLNSCYYDEVLPPPEVEVTQATFAADIIPILNSDCNGSGCHNGSVAPNLLPSNAYSALTNGGYVDKANPANSSIYLWMTGKKGTPMPPAGANATFNAKVLAWIKAGAQNN